MNLGSRRLCGLTCALFVGFAGMVLAGAKDLVFTCSTRGGDAYADGAPVADGECYALVYTENGTTFQGFTADGRAQNNTNSYVALAAPGLSAFSPASPSAQAAGVGKEGAEG